jgi:hypothetical protein
LARHPVRSPRTEAEPQFLPKMKRCNARTTEIYRRMGLTDEIRAADLSADVPMDVFIIPSMTRPPLLQLKCPSVDEARRRIREGNDGTLPLECGFRQSRPPIPI